MLATYALLPVIRRFTDPAGVGVKLSDISVLSALCWLWWLVGRGVRRCFIANSFTGRATRRSELPSHSTGFPALPSTLLYRAAVSRSSPLLDSAG